MASSSQSAIKRATLAAQREVEKLDAAAADELIQLYQQAAEDIARRIAGYAGSDGNVMLSELQSVLAQANDRLKQLAQARDGLLNQSLGNAADLGTLPFTAQGIGAVPLAGEGAAAVLTSAASMQINNEALQFVRNFVAEDGLQLSDRIWRLDRHALDLVTNSIEQAIIQGQGAAQAAREMLMRGEAVAGDIADKMNAANAQGMGKAAGELLTGEGSPMVNAMRLMRTEINRAHGEAYIKGALAHPDAAGVRFMLSPAHPKPDVCLRRGTLVMTKRGDVPIEQIVVGDMALTHQGRFKPVIRLYRSSSGQNGLVRLCCRAENNRTLEAVMTPNHPVLTPQGWTPAGDLHTGCRVVCVDAEEALPLQLFGVGAGRKGLTRSGGIASAGAARNTFRGLCDALRSLLRRTPSIDLSGCQQPTCSPMIDVAKRLSSCCRRAISGCLPVCASLTATIGTRLNAETFLDGAYHSSGLIPLCTERIRSSNTSQPCCSWTEQTAYRMSGMLASLWRAPFGNTPLNKTSSPLFQRATSALQTVFRKTGTMLRRISLDFSTEQSTCDCRTACSQSVTPSQTVQGLGLKVCCSARRASWLESKNNESLSYTFTPEHTTVETLQETGEDVFNLEVEGDHSYVANWIVVHNCDLLSTQNLHGLGAGVYPSREACPWPAHPNTLSFLEVVFKDEVKAADQAGKETSMQALARLTPEQRRGALGVNKAEVFDQGKMSKGMIRSKWSAVQKRIA